MTRFGGRLRSFFRIALIILAITLCPALVSRGAPGDRDVLFDPAPDGLVSCLCGQPDGRILVAGEFTALYGTSRGYLARLNAGGSLDTGFNPSLPGPVSCMELQADGKVVIAGLAGTGEERAGFVRRVSAAGVPESSYAAEITGEWLNGGGTPYHNVAIYAVAVQPDGAAIIAGSFSEVNGQPRTSLARLRPDGMLDASFTPALTYESGQSSIQAVAVQPDGKILIAGSFSGLNGTPRTSLARLLPDGTVDSGFNASVSGGIGGLLRQPDGKIVLCGYFGEVNGIYYSNMVRLNADGSTDPGFVSPFTTFKPAHLSLLVQQADGKLFVAGGFSTDGPAALAGLVRLLPDGTIDTTFEPGGFRWYGSARGPEALALLADGRLLAGGRFDALNGEPVKPLLRLENGPGTSQLSLSGTAELTWQRGGSRPEIAEAAFDLSTDGGVNWLPLGQGEYGAGAWQLSGLSLPAAGEIRLRGRTGSASAGLVEERSAFGGRTAAMVVEVPVNTARESGAVIDFGTMKAGTPALTKTVVLKNTGTAGLAVTGFNLTGPHPAEFSADTTGLPAWLPPGSSATFLLRYHALFPGARSAALHLRSNDAVRPLFTFNLSGTATPSDNAELAGIETDPAELLSPAFDPAVSTYTATVRHIYGAMSILPRAAGASAVVTVNGLPPGEFPLQSGLNGFTIVVTAQDGTTRRTYTVNVQRTPPVAGDVELAFTPSEVWRGFQGPGSPASVARTASLPDGSILGSGTFNRPQGPVVKFNPDGTLDPAFDVRVSGTDANVISVSCMAVLPAGRIFIGGPFNAVNGTYSRGLQRLRMDGTVDEYYFPGISGSVGDVLVQPDGKLLVSGAFPEKVARLLPNADRDGSFQYRPPPGLTGQGTPALMALQPDGKMLCSAQFSAPPFGIPHKLFRLNADGSADNTFAIAVENVNAVALQPDGKIIAGGHRQFEEGQPEILMKRLLPDGTVDPSFTANVGRGPEVVYTGVGVVALQTDGRVLIAGDFGMVDGVPVRGLARLMPDGSLDRSFTVPLTGGRGAVNSLSQQPDGMIVATGDFTTMGGLPRNGFAKLHNDPVTRSVQATGGGAFTWMRGGAAPEVDYVTLELSTDGGQNWQDYGRASRIPGGWQKTGLPAAGELRAHGQTQGPASSLETVETAIGDTAPALTVAMANGTVLPVQGAVVDFGEVPAGTGSVSRTLTVHNTGGTPLLISRAGLAGMAAGDFKVSDGVAGRRLSPGEEASLEITCQPAGYGLRAETLHIVTANPAVPAVAVSLRATALPNARLAGLALEGILLTPEFSPEVTAYAAATPLFNAVSTVRVRAAVSHSGATMTLKGRTLAPGVLSAPLALVTGVNVLPVVVTAADGATRRTYSITVTRLAPQGTLENLALEGGVLDPPYDPSVTTYRASVAAPVTAVKFTGQTVEPSGTVTANGVPVSPVYFLSGTVPVAPGLNIISVTGKSADGAALQTYTVELLRLPPGPFDPDPAWSYAGESPAFCAAPQPDGKMLSGGSGAKLYRHHADGAPDSAFSSSITAGSGDALRTLMVQDDGKILAGGNFQSYHEGVARNYLARLHPGGTIDQSFNLALDSPAQAITRMPGDRLLLGGGFTWVTEINRPRLAMINADGSVDTGFAGQPDGPVNTIARQPDGRILIGGAFNSVNGVTRRKLARLMSDGTLDTAFLAGADQNVMCLAVLPGGGILAAGEFRTIAGQASPWLARLKADGTMDPAWQASAILPGPVTTVAVQVDGCLLAGGRIQSVNGVTRYGMVRLLPDGRLDETFDAGFFDGSIVETLTLQADGAILAGGSFTYGGGLPAAGMVRLKNHEATRQLTVTGTARVQWLRGGTSPEAEEVTFDLSTNGGAEWTPLGAGSRIPGGWELTGLSLPAGGHIRARARVGGGRYHASSGLVESVVPFPLTPLEAWRQMHFSSVANTGRAANDVDADGDTLVNLVEFAFGLNPRVPDAGRLPQPRITGDTMATEFTHPAEADGLDYGAEWSPSLAAGSWQPVPDAGNGRQHRFSIFGSRGYMRLTVREL